MIISKRFYIDKYTPTLVSKKVDYYANWFVILHTFLSNMKLIIV
jgi:hypothetical protein